MSKLFEALIAGDLKNLVKDIFEIDSFGSKMGEDEDIVVLSFTVTQQEPAKDLVRFIENGYSFVLDADVSPGELDDNIYKVFIEIERNRKIGEQIVELLDGVKKLTSIPEFRFRYYKGFKSQIADKETLESSIPLTADDYKTAIKDNRLNNFSNFFNKSFIEHIDVDNDTLVFQKKYAESLRMKILGFDRTSAIYESAPGKIMLESKDIAEVLFLTKYLGNYNITKVGSTFVFENEGFAVLLEKV